MIVPELSISNMTSDILNMAVCCRTPIGLTQQGLSTDELGTDGLSPQTISSEGLVSKCAQN